MFEFKRNYQNLLKTNKKLVNNLYKHFPLALK